MNEVLLEAAGLTVGYKKDKSDTILFDHLDITLNAGELVCFMGPNGVGKSTLIRTLAGLQKPLGGKMSVVDAKSIALVLTDKITASNMPVYELISYGRYPYLNWNISLTEEDKRVIEDAIDEVRVRPLLDKKLYELSDGQMQMVMIARVLAQNTPILLLDEPTAHLDLNNRVEVMNLLRRLCRARNKAILIATHELDLALQTADQIWLATKDKKIKTGMPEDLVLDGSFDEVFQFKGFDLKTGKVQHEPYRGVAISLTGTGYEYLWTKNALERAGYEISDSSSITVSVKHDDVLSLEYDGKVFHTVKELVLGIQ